MWRILPVELGVNRNRNLERQTVRRGQSVAEDYSGNKPTLDSFAILDGNVAPLNEGLLLDISLVVCRRAASEQRDEGLINELEMVLNTSLRIFVTYSDVQGAIEAIAKLATALKLIAGKELVCSEPNAGIGRLGRVESGKDKLNSCQLGEQGSGYGSARTESFRASRETSSLNLFRQMRASRNAETPSSLRVKLRSAMIPCQMISSAMH